MVGGSVGMSRFRQETLSHPCERIQLVIDALYCATNGFGLTVILCLLDADAGDLAAFNVVGGLGEDAQALFDFPGLLVQDA